MLNEVVRRSGQIGIEGDPAQSAGPIQRYGDKAEVPGRGLSCGVGAQVGPGDHLHTGVFSLGQALLRRGKRTRAPGPDLDEVEIFAVSGDEIHLAIGAQPVSLQDGVSALLQRLRSQALPTSSESGSSSCHRDTILLRRDVLVNSNQGICWNLLMIFVGML